jgi:hypothetical protein
MDPKPSLLGRLSPVLVRLVAFWVLTGAGYKLFSGSPNDLPPIVREFFLGPELTFKLAIAIELSVVFVTLLRPRIGWILLSLQLLVFIAILIQLTASGEASCGCFGSKVTIPPPVMLAMDAVGLVLVLITRPWATLPKKEPHIGLALVSLLVAWAAPWLVISTPAPKAASFDEVTGEWKLPDEIPRFVELKPETWVGKPIHETELAVWLNVDEYPLAGTWVLYRVACDHCAAYLRRLHEEYPSDPKFYTFVRLSEEGEEEARQVDPDLMPPGPEALLPVTSWVITPPWRLELVDGVVTEAVFEGGEGE